MKDSLPRHADPAPDERRLPPLLRSAWFSLNQAFRRRLGPIDLTPDQFTVLRWLSEGPRGSLTQRELTERMASDANTIAALLKRMEAAALVERQADPHDRRANRVRLANGGRKRLDAARPVARALQEEVLDGLTARQRDQLLASLARVAEAARRAAERSGA